MKKIKNIVAVVLLFVITVLVVAVPRVTEYIHQKKRLSKSAEYCELSAVEHTEVTDRLVARLFLDNDITIWSLPSQKMPENAQNEIKRLLKIIFADKEELLKTLDFSQTENEINYNCGTVLVKSDNRPVALTFAGYTLENENFALELFYEKKTDTVVSVGLIKKVAFNTAEKRDKFVKEVDLSPYFADTLGLKNDEYYTEIAEEYLPDGVAEVRMHAEISREYYEYSEED